MSTFFKNISSCFPLVSTENLKTQLFFFTSDSEAGVGPKASISLAKCTKELAACVNVCDAAYLKVLSEATLCSLSAACHSDLQGEASAPATDSTHQ